MSEVQKCDRMKKDLSLFGVFALSTGTTLSAGFFLLPGLAAQDAGPAMILCYILAAVPMLPAILSILELSTAMPRSGGAYYFLDRSLGPLMGTVGGIATWVALVLKSAFALVGMGAYIGLFLPDDFPVMIIVALLGIGFGAVNLVGTKESAQLLIGLVVFLLTVVALFILDGSFHISFSNYENFFGEGAERIVATAGMLYIGYGGVMKVASVAEEVKNPDRNLPVGVLLSFGLCVLIYALGTTVMMGVLGVELLGHADHIKTPVAQVASETAGPWGRVLVSAAALAAFAAVANAGILSASRFPLAMSRDHLLPRRFSIMSRRSIPTFSVVVTTIVILLVIWIDLEKIVKLASASLLFVFLFLNVAVIVMRESRIESYDPGFRSPWYPWTQIAGIVLPIWFLGEMGLFPVVSVTIVAGISCGWYFYYARVRVVRHGAIFHLFERLGQRRFEGLDKEMRTILREKGVRPDDNFDELIESAEVLEASPGESFESVVRRVCEVLARKLPVPFDALYDGFLEGTRVGATPVGRGIALPHLRRTEVSEPHVVLVRAVTGVEIRIDDSALGKNHRDDPARAIFFLVSPEDDPGRHLRMLAQLAERADEDGFLDEWSAARDAQSLRVVLNRQERYLSIVIDKDNPNTCEYVGKSVRELNLPSGCLIVLVHREGNAIVPQGDTTLEAGDRLAIIGHTDGMAKLKSFLVPHASDDE